MIDVRIEWKEELGNLTAPIIQDALRHFVQTRNITVREIPAQPEQKYRADFLWPHENNSAEEAGFEFANGTTESYTQQWWDILKKRIRALPTVLSYGEKRSSMNAHKTEELVRKVFCHCAVFREGYESKQLHITASFNDVARLARRFVKIEQDMCCKKFLAEIEKRVRNKKGSEG